MADGVERVEAWKVRSRVFQSEDQAQRYLAEITYGKAIYEFLSGHFQNPNYEAVVQAVSMTIANSRDDFLKILQGESR